MLYIIVLLRFVLSLISSYIFSVFVFYVVFEKLKQDVFLWQEYLLCPLGSCEAELDKHLYVWIFALFWFFVMTILKPLKFVLKASREPK